MKHATPMHIFWDLGNTLLTIDSFSFARQMGLTDMMLYPLLEGTRHEEIVNKALAFLAHLSPQGSPGCDATAYGKALPPLACTWLSGKITLLEAQLFCKEASLKEYVPQGFFKSDREERLVKKLLQILTTPEAFTSSIKVIKSGITLLQECAAQHNEHGALKNTLYILSNWDPYSFKTMLSSPHLKELFTYFDHRNVIISGQIGLIKPQPALYEYVMSTYQLDAAKCLLIDDQEENIRGAQKIGMRTILLQDADYEAVRNELQADKIIR